MKVVKPQKAKKANYMSSEAFANLRKAMEDALAFERGVTRDLKVQRIQVRPRKTGHLRTT
jgi:hypothetical protein